jgi:flagellum-specific ATP synthase
MTILFDKIGELIVKTPLVRMWGEVREVKGILVEANGPMLPLGARVTITSGMHQVQGEVVGFRDSRILIMPTSDISGLAPGGRVEATEGNDDVLVGFNLLGRVVNANGEPIDGRPLPRLVSRVALRREPPNPFTRKKISEPFDVGIRCINTFLTVGVGQRVGIMAGSGVGKSTLLGMIARNSASDINIIALVGERGREVREFLEKDLGEEGLARSIVVVATGDQAAPLRVRAALLATAYAEYFRDEGKRVVLMVDSITRLAMAQRETGLAVGEPPSSRGYTPSVFSLLPRVLERTGLCAGNGSITAFYTVLVDGDDMNEPIADTTRGILDGHIVLSRKLSSKGHFPSIELLESVSRVMGEVLPQEALDKALEARGHIATYREIEDLLSIGAYKEGVNLRTDRSVALHAPLTDFLRQKPYDQCSMQDSWRRLVEVLGSQ